MGWGSLQGNEEPIFVVQKYRFLMA